MKVFIPNYQPERIGGGWTWTRYFVNAFGQSTYEEADIFLIPSASMVERSVVQQAKKDGKKIVLRTDNVIRNSRNRNTGMTRMRDFCELADLVIYQSEWAKKFLMPFTKKDGVVILNGVDTAKYSENTSVNRPDDSYLYVRSSRDEGKQWIMAWYWFVGNPGKLDIVGKFSHDNLEYNFDFYDDERYTFWGEQTNMVDLYRKNKNFLYTYLNEAGSNTLLEARASGCNIINVFGMLDTGCAPEYMALQDLSLERMVREYKDAISSIL